MTETTSPYQIPGVDSNTPPLPNSWKSVVVVFFLTAAIILVAAALLLPNIRNVRGGADTTHCKNNIKNIVLALHNYASNNGGQFPPAYTVDSNGKPLHSWRTLILAQLDQREMHDRVDFSKPWDDPVNAEVFKTAVRVYSCPSLANRDNTTTYQVIVSPSSCFPLPKSRNMSEITDGAGQTLLVVEMCSENAVPWMSPQDTDEQTFLAQYSKVCSPHTDIFNVGFADGSVGGLSSTCSRDVLEALITADGNDVLEGNEF